MTEKTYRISGKIVDVKSRAGIPGLRVEAWDNDLIFDDLVGSAVTDEKGNFLIEFSESYFSDIFLERSPDLFFKIYQNGELAYTTRNSIHWNVRTPELDIVIEIPPGGGEINPNEPMLRVYGIVRNELGEPLAGATVKAFDVPDSQGKTPDTPLGETRSDQNGRYQIEFSEAAYKNTAAERSGPNLVVRVYDQKGEEIGQSKQVNNAGRITELNVDINTALYRVHGIVLDSHGKPVQHVFVQAFDRDLRKLQPLGTVVETEANGGFRIDYKRSDFQLGDPPSRRAPWLIVEVRERPEGNVLASQELQRAEPIQYIEFKLPGEVASEWQRVGEAVEPLLKGQGTSGVEANSHTVESEVQTDLKPFELNAADIEFIMLETEVERAVVEAWIASSRMVRDAVLRLTDEHAAQQATLRDNGWPFFYGIARQGLAPDLDAVLRESSTNWQRAWRAARSANRVPVLDEKQLELLVDVLELLQRLQQLDPVRSGNSDFARILASTSMPLPTVVALDALSIFNEKGLDDPEALLKLAESHPDAEAPIKTFVRGARVHQLVSGHLALFSTLNARMEGSTSDSIAPLAALPSTEWMVMADEAAISHGRALLLQAQVEKQHPLTALKARLDGGHMHLPGVSGGEMVALVKEQPATVESILRGLTPVKDHGDETPPATHKVLRDVGRFVRTGVNMELAVHLMNTGIETPAVAIRYGQEHIREQLRDELPKEAADEIAYTFFEIVEPVLDGANGFLIDVAGGRALPWWMVEEYKIPLPESVRENLPSLPGLFGDLDECICKPCESMLGQPAYLVDLLSLVKKVPVGKAGDGALDLLRKRRPDIYDLELTCENAETELPYIDLVLEVLENAVGFYQYGFAVPRVPNTESLLEPVLDGSVRAALEPTATVVGPELQARRGQMLESGQRQWFVSDGLRRWTLLVRIDKQFIEIKALAYRRSTPGEDLKVAPENRNLLAYRNLAEQPYPWTMPFDLLYAETGLFLNRLGASREDLIRLQAAPDPVSLAAETLGIALAQPNTAPNDAEWALITEERSGARLWAAWGLSPAVDGTVTIRDQASGEDVSGQPIEVLSRVSVLMDRAAVDLDTLELVLATQYVGQLTIVNRRQCKTSQMQVGDLNEGQLDRIHRFIRLSRKLPDWNALLLDSAIMSSSTQDFTDDGDLQRLAKIEHLTRRLPLPVSHLLAMRQSLLGVQVALGDAGAPPRTLFAQIFQRTLAPHDQQAVFDLDWQRNELRVWDEQARPTMLSALGAVSAFLGINADTLVSLIDRGVVPNELNLSALTTLFRHHSLSKALGVTAQQLHQIRTICGINPFVESTDFEQLEAFCDAVDFIQASGLTIEDTAYALLPFKTLTGLDINPTSMRKSDVGVEERLKSLQAALRAVRTEIASLPQEPAVGQALARWMDSASARRVVAGIEASVLGPADTVPESNAIDALWRLPVRTSVTPVSQRLGEVTPLFRQQEAMALFVVPADAKRTAAEMQRRRVELQRRYSVILDRVAQRLREQCLVETVVAWTGWSLPLAADVLETYLRIDDGASGVAASEVLLATAFWGGEAAPAVDMTSRSDLHEWMHRLDRMVMLASALKLPVDAWPLLAQVSIGSTVGIDWRDVLAPGSIPSGVTWMPRWDVWRAFIGLVSLVGDDQLSLPTVNALFASVEGAQQIVADILESLATRLSVPSAEVFELAKHAVSNPPTSKSLRDPIALKRLLPMAQALRTLRASSVQFLALIDCTNNAAAALAARQLLQAKSGPAAWPTALAAVNDKLRMRQRDALVAHLVHRDGRRSANDLYEDYLIDPRVGPCLNTTRLLEAITATQLFAQRILFGLEPGISASNDLKQRWTWMRNYRVWEANRKVFLFPENWLYPELRDDKSSSFKQLESALGQGELTQDLARQSFGQFLDDVAQMGQVQVLGMYEHLERDMTRSEQPIIRRDLYVVGRTINLPYLYYWLRCIDFGSRWMEWSPWQRIELDIQGDHVLPFVINGDFHLAWSTQKKGDAKGASGEAWVVRLSWSRYDGAHWHEPNLSRDVVHFADSPFRDDRSGFYFRLWNDPGSPKSSVLITCYVAHTTLHSTAPQEESLTEEKSLEIEGFPASRPTQSKLYFVRDGAISILPGDSGWPPPDVTTDYSASRTLTWSCWIKVKAGSGTGWIELSPSSIHTINLRDEAGIESPISLGSTGIWLGFGSSTQSFQRHYPDFDPNAFVAERTWRVHARFCGPMGQQVVTSSRTFATTRVDTGRYVKVSLTCQLDASKFSAEELGLDITGMLTYKADAAFRIDADEKVTKEDALGFLLSPVNTRPWMNGYLEHETQGIAQDFFLEGVSTSSFHGSTIFRGSGSDAFFAVACGSNRLQWELPTIWHFSENNVGCLVDVAPQGGAGAKFRLYPSAYPEARNYRQEWRSLNRLVEPNLQIGVFGADQLPTAGPYVAQDTWILDLTKNLDLRAQGDLSYDSRMPYACYNWEVFFHAPLLIADQLSKQHKFEDAEQWLRYVFDPTSGGPGSDAKRFLKFRVFKELDLRNQVIADLTALAQVAGGFATETDTIAVQKLIGRWRDAPFLPFLIARRRHIAFLWRTLFAYLDNLMAWADSLYRRDTRESINEATMLYVLAERILGRRPQRHEGSSKRTAFNYQDLAGKWDDFANYWIDVGTRSKAKPYMVNDPNRLHNTVHDNNAKKQPSPDGMLYFCMPFNDKIFSYWNIIEERLFNVRHCRNIEGIERSLPLTDAPIDPELLVRATAAGLDLGDVISGLYAPPPHYRYNILSARAAELANEAKALGAAMLSAIEKRDAEHLAQLRSSNEISLLRLVREVRTLQITEAERNLDALRATRKSVSTRYSQYQRLLGKKAPKAPTEQEGVGEESMLGSVDGLASGHSNWGLIKEENEQYTGFQGANTWSIAAGISKAVAGTSHTAAQAWDPLKHVGNAASAIGDGFSVVSQAWRAYAEQQGMMASHIRRRDEWAFQSNQTLKELQQIDKQILANQIRVDITRKELNNHIEQVEQAQAVDEVMRSKFSNEQLYQWMISQLSGLYFNAYRMALEMARRAERAAARELGVKPLNILRNDYWDSLRSGLLAGERLHQDIKRLEVTYLDQNRREYELTKHISLRRLAPEALVALRIKNSTAGNCSCTFDIPEWLFDLDTAGHYLRRIKSVSVSIPCVVGPYASVNCKLTLLSSQVRHERTPQPQYGRSGAGDDSRFTDYFGASEAIVTSTANGDSGLFETQLRDERFLPFEGSGVISTWWLELPGEYPQFDYSTISDVVLSIRYTARDGGDTLREAATGAISTQLSSTAKPLCFPVVLSCRSDFPTEWARAVTTGSALEIPITRDLLPYWMDAARVNRDKLEIRAVTYAKLEKEQTSPLDFVPANWPVKTNAVTLVNLGEPKVNGNVVADVIVLLSIGK